MSLRNQTARLLRRQKFTFTTSQLNRLSYNGSTLCFDDESQYVTVYNPAITQCVINVPYATPENILKKIDEKLSQLTDRKNHFIEFGDRSPMPISIARKKMLYA